LTPPDDPHKRIGIRWPFPRDCDEFDAICGGWILAAVRLFGDDAAEALRALKGAGRGGSDDWPGAEEAERILSGIQKGST
jgi:hypothetical protein